ncbi:hypothetical protein HK096_002055 [Nowakowskiella sp. JEL0078]|nr:hypothetical protein HK096_002055 [Nowakowskiella sp. JEL0078]
MEIIFTTQNFTIFIAVTAFYLLDFSINAVQAMCRALIVDICPLSQQEIGNAWAGRMLGFGSILGFFIGYIDLPALFPFFGDIQIQILCIIAIIFFVTTVGITSIYVKEKPYFASPESKNTKGFHNSSWIKPLWDIIRAFWSLPPQIQSVCNVQFFAWLAWSTWISERTISDHPLLPILLSQNSPEPNPEGTRAGSFALMLKSVLSLVAVLVLPTMTTYCHRFLSEERSSSFFTPVAKFCSSLPKIWSISLFFYSTCLFATYWVSEVTQAIFLVSLIGIPWGIGMWLPFTLIGEYVSNLKDSNSTTLKFDDPSQISADLVVTNHGSNSLSNRNVRYQTATSSSSGFTEIHENDEEKTILSDSTRAPQPNLDAGIIIGIHNIYIVMPQFVSTFLNAIIFTLFQIFNGGKSDGDEVGWVLRIGGLFGIVAAVLALKIITVSGNRRGNVVTFSAH